jgi:hypothetical protein
MDSSTKLTLNRHINQYIKKIKIRPIFIEDSEKYPEAYAEIIINNTSYHIIKMGATITFDTMISKYNFDSSHIKLYAYNRHPNFNSYSECIELPDKIIKIDEINKIQESDDIIKPTNGYFWVPVPKKYHIYDGEEDLIFIQAYPTIVFTLTDAIIFYEFLLNDEKHYNCYMIPPSWHSMKKYTNIIISDAYKFEILSGDSDSDNSSGSCDSIVNISPETKLFEYVLHKSDNIL